MVLSKHDQFVLECHKTTLTVLDYEKRTYWRHWTPEAREAHIEAVKSTKEAIEEIEKKKKPLTWQHVYL